MSESVLVDLCVTLVGTGAGVFGAQALSNHVKRRHDSAELAIARERLVVPLVEELGALWHWCEFAMTVMESKGVPNQSIEATTLDAHIVGAAILLGIPEFHRLRDCRRDVETINRALGALQEWHLDWPPSLDVPPQVREQRARLEGHLKLHLEVLAGSTSGLLNELSPTRHATFAKSIDQEMTLRREMWSRGKPDGKGEAESPVS